VLVGDILNIEEELSLNISVGVDILSCTNLRSSIVTTSAEVLNPNVAHDLAI
jgi:hypothetical protein